MPEDAEVLGVRALMAIQASRLLTRISPDGAPVPLTEQDRTRWDYLLICRGLMRSPAPRRWAATGPYLLQATLALCHNRARVDRAADINWQPIAALRPAAHGGRHRPVDLNRAVAHSMAFEPKQA